MISNVLGLFFATFFGGAMLYVTRINYPANRLTVRGNRLVFLLLSVLGFIIYQVAIHFYVNCDLTQPNSVCEIGWI
jgi:hypothetical protein